MKKTIITIMILFLAVLSLSTILMAENKSNVTNEIWKVIQGEWENEDGGSATIKDKEIEYFNVVYQTPDNINDPMPDKPKELVAIKGTMESYLDKNNEDTIYFKVKGVKIICNLNGDCISQDDNYKDDMFFWIKYPDAEYTIVPCEGLQPVLSKKK